MVTEIPARKPMNASLLMAVCAALVVKPLEATQIMIRHWIAASLLLALGVMLLPASGYAQSSDPEQQKKEQEFISEVNRKIEREFQIREKIRAEKSRRNAKKRPKPSRLRPPSINSVPCGAAQCPITCLTAILCQSRLCASADRSVLDPDIVDQAGWAEFGGNEQSARSASGRPQRHSIAIFQIIDNEACPL